MTLAAERLGARIGLIAVLHTWGQTLTHHPHVHCLVPGGGVALDGQRWVACKPNFLLSVRALSKTFRRLFLDGLAAAFRRGELGFFGELAPLADPAAFAERVRALRKSPFVVYAKPPFGGPERVLAYLARYTHRTAIANSRLVAVDDDEVAFSYKDYRRGGRDGVMRLAPHEFIRRFLLHVLPDGFHRIRHYGFLARGDRGENLARVRALLKVQRTHRARGPSPASDDVRARAERRRPTKPSLSARTAAVACAASALSRRITPAPFAATHHDHKRRPDLDRLRLSTPPSRYAAGPGLRASSGPVWLASTSAPRRRRRSRRSNRPQPTGETFDYRQSPPSPAPNRAPNSKPPRAFPIAANRPAPSFNPAYVRSPSVTPQPARRRPHITLQIPI